MPACLRVGALLQNSEENFVVGGSPVGIVALRVWLTELEESCQNCGLTSHDLIGLAITVPFHDPTWLGEAALLTTDDMHVRKVCKTPARPSQDNLHTRFHTSGNNSVTSQNSVIEMNAFIRELMYMPVSWPTSLCFAATLITATYTWEPTTCHMDIYGPRCSKVMLGKALSSTPLLPIICFSEGDNVGSGETFRKIRCPQSDIVSAKWLLALSTAVESITGTSSAITLEKSDAPLISSAGLSSAQALAVAEELRHMFGLNKIPKLLLFDYPTPAEIARFLSTMTNSYDSSLILDIKSMSNGESQASEECKLRENKSKAYVTSMESRRAPALVDEITSSYAMSRNRRIYDDALHRQFQSPPAYGRFLYNIDLFDTTIFAMSIGDGKLLDPQQRFLLELALKVNIKEKKTSTGLKLQIVFKNISSISKALDILKVINFSNS